MVAWLLKLLSDHTGAPCAVRLGGLVGLAGVTAGAAVNAVHTGFVDLHSYAHGVAWLTGATGAGAWAKDHNARPIAGRMAGTAGTDIVGRMADIE